MAKSGTSTEGTTRVIDADNDPDGVSAALGLDDAPDDEQDPDEDGSDDGADDEGGEDELTLESLAEQLAELRRDNAKLKREAAAARVKAKAKPKGTDTREVGNGVEDNETVEQALERGREEARLELGLERAGDRIRAALTGIVPDADLDDFIDDLRLERYVGEDGKPDTDAIAALKDRQAKITRRKRSANTGHGRQGSGTGVKSKGEVMAETLTALGIG